MNTLEIFHFHPQSDISNWVLINDVVMGGESKSTFNIDVDGNGVFKGNVSLENNGGFSLLRYSFNKIDILNFKQIKLRLKGDGKRYQFRVKPNKNNKHSYITFFQTTKNWQTITIKLADLIPQYRGRRLSSPNFLYNELEEIGFLIGNKKDENFKLLIDSIILD